MAWFLLRLQEVLGSIPRTAFFVRLGWHECRKSLPRGPVAQWIRHRPTETRVLPGSYQSFILWLSRNPTSYSVVKKVRPLAVLSPSPLCLPQWKHLWGVPVENFPVPTLFEQSQMCQKKKRPGDSSGRGGCPRKTKGAQKIEFCPLKNVFAIYSTTTAFAKVPSKKFFQAKKTPLEGRIFSSSILLGLNHFPGELAKVPCTGVFCPWRY